MNFDRLIAEARERIHANIERRAHRTQHFDRRSAGQLARWARTKQKAQAAK